MGSGNLVVNGSAHVYGGEFEKVSIRGEARITGDVRTNKVSVYGDATFYSDVNAEVISILGEAKFAGAIEADLLKIYGNANVDKVSKINLCKIRGNLDLKNNLSGNKIDNKGGLNVNGNVSVDQFYSTGVCQIDGLLTAEEINIKMRMASSRITEMGGGKITVNRGKPQIRSKKPLLETTQIEADEIYIEYTQAGIVRGNNVTIGPGCDIGVVEYKNQIRVSPNAKVDKQIKC